MAASFAKALVQMRRAIVHDESWDSGWVFDIKTDAAPGTGEDAPGTPRPATGASVPAPERCAIDDQATAEDFP